MPTACPRWRWTCDSVQPDKMAAVPKKLAARHKVFPLSPKGKTLTLLMVDPADHRAVAEVG